jgi:hypothetical protein
MDYRVKPGGDERGGHPHREALQSRGAALDRPHVGMDHQDTSGDDELKEEGVK